MKTTISIKSPAAELGQAQPSITKDKSTKPEEWETRDHLDTLTRAHEIKADPVKMRHVKKLAGRKMKAMRSISDLKDYRQKQFGGPGGGPKPDEDSESSF